MVVGSDADIVIKLWEKCNVPWILLGEKSNLSTSDIN